MTGASRPARGLAAVLALSLGSIAASCATNATAIAPGTGTANALEGAKATPGATIQPAPSAPTLSELLEKTEGDLGGFIEDRLVCIDPTYDDVAVQRYVATVGARIAGHAQRTNVPFRFAVTEDLGANAYAVLGGHVRITRGLVALLDSEAELAGVLAHEVAHVELGHTYESAEAMVVPTPIAVSDRALDDELQRDAERAADRRALELLRLAGYAPRAYYVVLEKLRVAELVARTVAESNRAVEQPKTWTRTHPLPDARLARIARSLRGDDVGIWERDVYRRATEGLSLDDRHLGVLTRDRFVLSRLGIQFTPAAGMQGSVEDHIFSGRVGNLEITISAFCAGPIGSVVTDALAGSMKHAEPFALPGGFTGEVGAMLDDHGRALGVGVLRADRGTLLVSLRTPWVDLPRAGTRLRDMLVQGTAELAELPDAARPTRIRGARAIRAGTPADVVRASCPSGVDHEHAAELFGLEPDAVVPEGAFVKCLER